MKNKNVFFKLFILYSVAVILFSCKKNTVDANSNPTVFTFKEVTSATGRIWMDRNLGAKQVATSSTDTSAYGDLYQWGRGADGHQLRTSVNSILNALSITDQPNSTLFIITASAPYDWRSGQNNNLWQGVSGINNPCPAGYRLPTATEWNDEIKTWSSNNAAGAFASPLKLTIGGFRKYSDGSIFDAGIVGHYWASSVILGTTNVSSELSMGSSYTNPITPTLATNSLRANGMSIRCIKN